MLTSDRLYGAFHALQRARLLRAALRGARRTSAFYRWRRRWELRAWELRFLRDAETARPPQALHFGRDGEPLSTSSSFLSSGDDAPAAYHTRMGASSPGHGESPVSIGSEADGPPGPPPWGTSDQYVDDAEEATGSGGERTSRAISRSDTPELPSSATPITAPPTLTGAAPRAAKGAIHVARPTPS